MTNKNPIDFYNYDVAKRNNLVDSAQASYRLQENSSKKYNVFEEQKLTNRYEEQMRRTTPLMSDKFKSDVELQMLNIIKRDLPVTNN